MKRKLTQIMYSIPIIVLSWQAVCLAQAQLVVESATLSPLTYQMGVSGQRMSFDICLRNDGTDASVQDILSPFATGTLYSDPLSDTPLPGPDGDPMYVLITSVDGGQTLCAEITFDFPEDFWTSAGTKVVGFRVDSPLACRTLFEITVVEGPVIEEGPDLVDAGSVSGTYFEPQTVERGELITIHGSILNAGTQTAGPFDIAFYASTDTVIGNGDDIQIGDIGHFNLALGPGDWSPFHAPRPADIPAGRYYVGWMLDVGNAIAETDETNNTHCITSTQLTVRGTQPDLYDGGESYRAFSPRVVQASSTIEVHSRVYNGGAALTDNFAIGIYIFQPADPDNITPADITSGWRSDWLNITTDLGQGDFRDWSQTVTIGYMPAGIYYVGWQIDAYNAVQEADENNNTAYVVGYQLTVNTPEYDLHGNGQGEFSPTQVQPGEWFVVDIQGCNSGWGNIEVPFTVDYYASENTVIDPEHENDHFIGSYRRDGIINPGECFLNRMILTEFPDIPGGTYYLGCILDSGNEVQPEDETNNRAVLLSPMLTVERVDIPPDADAGSDQVVEDSDNDDTETVHLDGSGSTDSDGTIESWEWTWTDENGDHSASGETVNVELPVGEHEITLTVTDNDGLTDTDTVTIVITAGPQPPAANAGPDQVVEDSDNNGTETVHLDGSDSTDVDGTIESWEWTWTDEDGAHGASGETTDVELPVGEHEITLTVTDNDGLTDTDTVTIVVTPGNEPPVAVISRNNLEVQEIEVMVGPDDDARNRNVAKLALDGSGSTDADGTIGSWVWTDENGNEIAHGETVEVELEGLPPTGGTQDLYMEHTITLTVEDNDGGQGTATVVVTVVTPGSVPVINYIGVEVTPIDSDMRPSRPTSRDIVQFSARIANFRNVFQAVEELGIPSISLDPQSRIIKLDFENPQIQSIPPGTYADLFIQGPVAGIGARFGPLEEGRWRIISEKIGAQFDHSFEVFPYNGPNTIVEEPTVITLEAVDVDSRNATLVGKITDDGGGSCWGRFEYWYIQPPVSPVGPEIPGGEIMFLKATPVSSNPADLLHREPEHTDWIGATEDIDGSMTDDGTFRYRISGLTPNHTYWIFAQAENSAGTNTGDMVSFTTPAAPRIVGGINSKHCNPYKHTYFLDGISLWEEFTVKVDWSGLAAGEIQWQTPKGIYKDYCPTAEHCSEMTRRFDVGTEFGVGGQLKVRAVSRGCLPSEWVIIGMECAESKWYTANFSVIPQPPIPPVLTLKAESSPQTDEDRGTLTYTSGDPVAVTLLYTDLVDLGLTIPDGIPIFGGYDLGLSIGGAISVSVGDGWARIEYLETIGDTHPHYFEYGVGQQSKSITVNLVVVYSYGDDSFGGDKWKIEGHLAFVIKDHTRADWVDFETSDVPYLADKVGDFNIVEIVSGVDLDSAVRLGAERWEGGLTEWYGEMFLYPRFWAYFDSGAWCYTGLLNIKITGGGGLQFRLYYSDQVEANQFCIYMYLLIEISTLLWDDTVLHPWTYCPIGEWDPCIDLPPELCGVYSPSGDSGNGEFQLMSHDVTPINVNRQGFKLINRDYLASDYAMWLPEAQDDKADGRRLYQTSLPDRDLSLPESERTAELALLVTSLMDPGNAQAIIDPLLSGSRLLAHPGSSTHPEPPTTTSITSGETVLQANVFKHSEPALVATDSGLCMAWIYDEPGRSATNRTQVVFSRSDGDTWTPPVPVHDDGTADFSPQLAVLPSGQVLCVWQNANRLLPADAELSDMAAALDIAVASYDSAAGLWRTEMLTDDSHMDHAPLIKTAPDNTALVVWLSNDKNDILGQDETSTNTIRFSVWNGSTWLEPGIAATDIGSILTASMAYNGAQAVYVYANDVDGDRTTNEDMELFALIYDGLHWSQPLQLTANDLWDTNPQVVFDQGEPLLVWHRDGSIVSCHGLDTGNLQQVVHSADVGARGFQLVRNLTGRISLVWTGASVEDIGVDIFTATFDPVSHLWSDAYPLTSDRDPERSLAATYVNSDELVLAYNKDRIKLNDQGIQETYQTDLCLLRHGFARDLSVAAEDITVSEANPQPGSVVQLTAVVHNLGDVPELDVPVAFYHGDPTQDGVMIDDYQIINGLLPVGETAEVTIPWTIPQVDSPQEIYVVVFFVENDPTAMPERSWVNNVASIYVMIPELKVESFYSEKTAYKTRRITARVANEGMVTARNVAVTIRLNSKDGQQLQCLTIPEIAVGSSQNISWDWDISAVQFDDPEIVLHATAETVHTTTGSNGDDNTAITLVHVSKPGDITDDGSIDDEDLAVLQDRWLDTSSDPDWLPAADLNHDGRIDMGDYNILDENWLWEASWHTE